MCCRCTPFPQVFVKTKTQYQLQQQSKRRLYVPSIRRFNINFYSSVSEKTKVRRGLRTVWF